MKTCFLCELIFAVEFFSFSFVLCLLFLGFELGVRVLFWDRVRSVCTQVMLLRVLQCGKILDTQAVELHLLRGGGNIFCDCDSGWDLFAPF